ncbi:MFS transporter [Iodidimonas sp. SYSU 1G8]|uniref:MFS transporter n=1 Tax=Iodidimonas sp. SYSU 1G8 TaxID=3133967 RepID=UPI0031FF0C4F
MKIYYGWYVVAVAMLFQAVTFGLGSYSFTFWVESWTSEFSADRADVMVATTLFTVALGVMGPAAGWAFDRVSMRLLICCGGLVYALGLALISVSTALWQIIAIYAVLLGMGFTLAGSLAGQTLAAKWFRGKRGFAIGIVSIGSSIGGFLLPPMVAFLIGEYDWRTAQRILAVFTAAAIIPLAWLIIRNSPEAAGIDPDPESDISRQAVADGLHRSWTYPQIARERTFWLLIVAILPPALAFAGIMANLRPYTADIGITPQQSATLMSAIAISMFASKFGIGALADRVDLRFLYWAAALPMIAAMALMLGTPSYPLMLVMATMIGFTGGSHMALMGAIVGARFGPASFGKVIGLLLPFLTLSATGAVISAWIRDSTGSYDLAHEVYIGLALIAAAGVYFLPTAKKRT